MTALNTHKNYMWFYRSTISLVPPKLWHIICSPNCCTLPRICWSLELWPFATRITMNHPHQILLLTSSSPKTNMCNCRFLRLTTMSFCSNHRFKGKWIPETTYLTSELVFTPYLVYDVYPGFTNPDLLTEGVPISIVIHYLFFWGNPF